MLRHCVENRAGLKPLLLGNRVELLGCLECDALWCYASHGEGVSEPAGLIWPYAVVDWQKAYDLDDGISLRQWHLRNMKQSSRHIDHPCGRKVCRFRSRGTL
jgi:hypothetical protein